MNLRRPVVHAAGAVVVSALLIACGFTRSPEPQSQPATRDPGPAPATTSARTPGPTKTTNQGNTNQSKNTGTLYSRETAGTRQRVACSEIETELKLVAYKGAVNWTSRVVDNRTSTGVGNPVSSVSVTPSSGSLASDGASVVVKIRGTYPAAKQKFWVLFEYPTSSGSGSVDFDVSC